MANYQSGRKGIKAARAMVSVYRRLGPEPKSIGEASRDPGTSHTMLRTLDFILRAVESWGAGGLKRFGQPCILERNPAGETIEKHRKLSKQNEVRDDSRVAQIQRYQE